MNWYDKSKLLGRFRKLNNTEKTRIYEFRDNPTPAEAALWDIVKNKQINGYKFRRQHKVGQFVVDFYCHKAELVIEVDGAVHNEKKAEDIVRADWLMTLGLQIVRFRNEDVLANPIMVKEKLLEILKSI